MNKQLRVAIIALTAIRVLFCGIPAFADSPGTPVNCDANQFSFGQHMVVASSGEVLFKLTSTEWTQMSLPGEWEQVRVVGEDTVYLYSNETGNLFRSPDGGLHWTLVTTSPLPDSVNANFYVAPDNSTLFLAALDLAVLPYPNQSGIWRSLDDGVTWQRTLDTSSGSPSVLSPLAFSPAFSQDGTVFAAQTGRGTFIGIWKSSDFGRSWSSANDGMQVPTQFGPPTWITISPQFSQDGTMFHNGASLNEGFYKSTNAGTTWQFSGGLHSKDAALSPNYLADQVILIASSGSGVHLSSDGGASFSIVWSRTGALIVGLRQVSTPLLEYWVVAQGVQRGVCYLYRSSDQGASWEPQVLFETPYAVYLPIMSR